MLFASSLQANNCSILDLKNQFNMNPKEEKSPQSSNQEKTVNVVILQKDVKNFTAEKIPKYMNFASSKNAASSSSDQMPASSPPVQKEPITSNPTKEAPSSNLFYPPVASPPVTPRLSTIRSGKMTKISSKMEPSSKIVSRHKSKPSSSPQFAAPASKPLVNIGNTTQMVFCKLCRKNGEPEEVYSSHSIKSKDGKVTCPVLKNYKCELCGATGENSHTKTHCPLFVDTENAQVDMPNYRIMSNGRSTFFLNHK